MSWKTAFEQGLGAFKDKRFEDAVEWFTKSIDADGTHPHVFDSRAAAYEQLRRFREALSDTRKCISLQPERYQSYFRTARIFLSMGKYDRCLQMVEAARKRLNPADAGYPKRIDELSRVEQSAKEAEARKRAHVDPLRKLPLELLFDICRMVVQQSDMEHPRGASHFAVTLGSVCRSLREMVHSTPWFWQSLTISEDSFSRKSSFWLDRLDGQPLYSLSLVNFGLVDLAKLKAFLEQTRPPAWKHLYVSGQGMYSQEIYELVRSLELQLHSLTVLAPPQIMQPAPPYDPSELVSRFSPPPSPHCTRRLTLYVGTLSMSCATLPHITHLGLSFNKLISSQLEPLFYIFRAVPNLKSLIIRPANVFVNNQHPNLPPLPDFKGFPVLRLEHLEELRISTIGPLQSLTTLQFPKLQILDLQQLPVSKPAILVRYLTDCDPSDRAPLRELRLSRVAMHPPLLLSLLTTCHETLEILEVSYCTALPPDLFSTLSFPELRDVNFSGTDELRAPDLVKMVKNGKGKIRHVIVDACPNVDAEALPWLRANVSGTGQSTFCPAGCSQLLINHAVRQPRLSPDVSSFWNTPIHPFDDQKFAFIHAPGFEDHVTLQEILVKLDRHLASNQPRGQPLMLTRIIYVYPEETPDDSILGPILHTLKAFIGRDYAERVTLYLSPGKESRHGVGAETILNLSPAIRSFYGDTPNPKITTSSLHRPTIDRILGSYAELGACRTYVQNKTALGEWTDDNICEYLRHYIADAALVEGPSPGPQVHTCVGSSSPNDEEENRLHISNNDLRKQGPNSSIQIEEAQEVAYKERIHELEQKLAECAPLMSDMHPRDTIEEPQIIEMLDRINDQIEEFARGFSKHLVDNYTRNGTITSERSLPGDLLDILGDTEAGSPVGISTNGVSPDLGDLSSAIRTLLCSQLYERIFKPFHPSLVDNELENTFITEVFNETAYREPQPIVGRWRKNTYLSISRRSTVGGRPNVKSARQSVAETLDELLRTHFSLATVSLTLSDEHEAILDKVVNAAERLDQVVKGAVVLLGEYQPIAYSYGAEFQPAYMSEPGSGSKSNTPIVISATIALGLIKRYARGANQIPNEIVICQALVLGGAI